MDVKVKGLPFYLHYDEDKRPFFINKDGEPLLVGMLEALQFEQLAKQDDILSAIKRIEKYLRQS